MATIRTMTIPAISSALAAVLLIASAPPRSANLTFAETVIQVGKGPGHIAVADVNHDGKPDVVVANTEDATISVLLGDGNGHFSSPAGSPFACGKNPSDISVADMNGDGTPDLIVANTQTPYITILLGNGGGQFRPSAHSPFATSSQPHPHGVAVGDFGKTASMAPALRIGRWFATRKLLEQLLILRPLLQLIHRTRQLGLALGAILLRALRPMVADLKTR